jgi:hypothetical protein
MPHSPVGAKKGINNNNNHKNKGLLHNIKRSLVGRPMDLITSKQSQ